jgi:hypothetical protein
MGWLGIWFQEDVDPSPPPDIFGRGEALPRAAGASC